MKLGTEAVSKALAPKPSNCMHVTGTSYRSLQQALCAFTLQQLMYAQSCKYDLQCVCFERFGWTLVSCNNHTSTDKRNQATREEIVKQETEPSPVTLFYPVVFTVMVFPGRVVVLKGTNFLITTTFGLTASYLW